MQRGATLLLVLFLLEGCTSFRIPGLSDVSEVGDSIDLIAVLPVESGPPPSGEKAGDVAPEAEKAVTAAIYGALSGSYEWRFVPDLTIADALRKVDTLASPGRQALALGKAVDADAVLSGSVWRFVERAVSVAAEERGASVGFTLRLISVASGEMLWEKSFERTQTELVSSVVDWMMFWEDNPEWMSAAELTQAGVDELMDDLRRRLN